MKKFLLPLLLFLALGGVFAIEPYKISPSDVIDITVLGEPDLSKQVVVPPDGKITYPLIGEIDVIGLTTQELANKLTQRLKEFIKEPNVAVSIVKFSFNKFYVLGEVAKPGEYDLVPGIGLREAIALAGGLKPEADTSSLILLNREGKKEIINFDEILKGGEDIKLQPGDTVILPTAVVSVIGEVRVPGQVTLFKGAKLMEIIARCGGITENADISNISITRAGKTIYLDLSNPKSLNPDDLTLQPGDVIYVPRGNIKVVVMGEVGKPGIYTISQVNGHLLDVLALAGGLRSTAEERAITVTRQKEEGTERITIDLRRASRGEQSQNIEMKNNDIVFVPAKKQLDWSRYLSIASILYYISYITRR
jgi:polysaccharide export outer membrane protein